MIIKFLHVKLNGFFNFVKKYYTVYTKKTYVEIIWFNGIGVNLIKSDFKFQLIDSNFKFKKYNKN